MAPKIASKNSKQSIKFKLMLHSCKKYAKLKGFVLQPDKEILHSIINGLVANQTKYGYRYCPCRIITGNPEIDRKNICPCTFHLSEIREWGACKCTLFLKKR